MSDALAKLRRHFGDELLLRHGTQYDLTPLALLLRDRVAESVDSVERTFRIRGDFDPATSDRTFTIIASTNGLAVFIKPLMAQLRDAGPGVRVKVRDLNSSTGALEPALRSADALLAPRGFISGYPALDLYQDDWVCLRAADREVDHGPLTLEELVERPWVVAHDQQRAQNPALRHLAALGLEPRVELLVEDFVCLPLLVAHTDRIAVLPGRLAAWFTGHEGLDISPLPVQVPSLTEALWWHPAHSRDTGHAWFRRLVRSTAQAMAD
ncbi:LysR family transcriptional regulator [Streptomyces spongiae]|uniref:LysR family transcriptional regulator n=2 Tax=Streptomyces spongiae TaxID=565072 RepID=A0A5N8XGY2_9ACTN|nr:LysR family transcriptional regulator [Streptomyces spongiae]